MKQCSRAKPSQGYGAGFFFNFFTPWGRWGGIGLVKGWRGGGIEGSKAWIVDSVLSWSLPQENGRFKSRRRERVNAGLNRWIETEAAEHKDPVSWQVIGWTLLLTASIFYPLIHDKLLASIFYWRKQNKRLYFANDNKTNCHYISPPDNTRQTAPIFRPLIICIIIHKLLLYFPHVY